MIARVLLALAAWPLVIYPGVFMAGIMGLAAEPNSEANPLTVLVATAFMWASLLYPIGYIAALVIGRQWSYEAGATVAMTHLLTCIALLAVWYGLST